MKKNKEYLDKWEVFLVYLFVIALLFLAYIKSNSLGITAIILATLVIFFIVIFRKRPNSANFQIGIPISKIDARWHLKRGETMPKDKNGD